MCYERLSKNINSMGKDKFSKTLGWDVFQSLGNPDNPELSVDEDQETQTEANMDDVLRVYLERKGRGGKEVSIIKGLSLSEDELTSMCKQLKSKCGVGGSVKNGEIIIQGDQRKRLIKELHMMGYDNVKNAGA